MGGLGRNIPVLKELKPKCITLVDINHLSINQVKKDFEKDNKVKAFCNNIDDYIKKDDSQYGAIIGIWTLSYLDEP